MHIADRFIQHATTLKVGRRNGAPAPFKPVMLLAVLLTQAHAQQQAELLPFPAIAPQYRTLHTLLTPAAPWPSNLVAPLYALETDGLLNLVPLDQTLPQDRWVSWRLLDAKRQGVAAYLPPELLTAAERDPTVLARLARDVLAHYAELLAQYGLHDRPTAQQALQALFPHPAAPEEVALAPAEPAEALPLVGPG